MIRLLDSLTVGRIAAGEVVERPLSVVKELVENALDAGARRIAVDVRRGGLESIEVADDGAGIAPDELALAFARHATSKLAAPEDLERIATLGFRGEGLASVAAVARVTLTSRTRGSDVGYAVEAHELGVGAPEPVAAPPGTRVAVRELFANVPARRAYMRSPGAEFTRIAQFLAQLALGYPGVAISLAHDGRAAFTFASAQALDQRLAHVFGGAQARALVELRGGDAPGASPAVRGWVSVPGEDRGDRRMQVLFVNGRLLRTTLLAGAWSAAYATYALSGRHAYGVLFVDVAHDGVDPNVHPQKHEVRLRSPEAAHDAVRRTIAETLARDARERMIGALSLAPYAGGAGFAAAPGAREGVGGAPHAATPARLDAPRFALDAGGVRDAAADAAPAHADLRVLAQLDDTFVLATDGSALVLVDQHAAHERVAYEAIAARARAGDARVEPLLVPLVLELDAAAVERFERARPVLAAAGLEAELFGERAIRVTATPAGYGARAFDLRGALADLADDVAGLDADERVWASLACHSVARAGERLEHAEMHALLARLVRCANPMHCPHGRPTIVRVEPAAIARMFKR